VLRLTRLKELASDIEAWERLALRSETVELGIDQWIGPPIEEAEKPTTPISANT
jgi:hypothetical protein